MSNRDIENSSNVDTMKPDIGLISKIFGPINICDIANSLVAIGDFKVGIFGQDFKSSNMFEISRFGPESFGF